MVYWSNFKKNYSPESYKKYLHHVKTNSSREAIKTYNQVGIQRKYPNE